MSTGILFLKTSLPSSGGIDVEVWVKAGTTFDVANLKLLFNASEATYASYTVNPAVSWAMQYCEDAQFIGAALNPINSGSSDVRLITMHFNTEGSPDTVTFLMDPGNTRLENNALTDPELDIGELYNAVVGLHDTALVTNYDGVPADTANPGEAFKDFIFDPVQESDDSAYYATINEGDGTVYLYDDDGGGLSNRYAFVSTEDDDNEWGKIEYGANNSVTLITLSESGQALETEEARLAFDSTGRVVGLYLLENHLPTGSVTISGTATQGQTLTAGNTLADADGLGTVSYQWKANGANIGGATGGTLVLTEAQVDQMITVEASYTDGHSTAEQVTSAATGAVANVNDSPTGSVTISGTATKGQTLTASNTLADADGLGTISYQWKANGVNIGGATGSTLVLTEAQVGQTITVEASYTDGHNTHEHVSSQATVPIADVNDFAPVISPLELSVNIAEDSSAGQINGADVNATDADGNILQYSLVDSPVDGSGNPLFSVDSSTGQVSLTSAGAAILDFETTDHYDLSVAVNDGDPLHQRTAAVTVEVTDANDAPTVASPIADQSTQEDAVLNFTVPLNAFEDVDAGDSLSYGATLADGSALPSWLSFNAPTRTFSGTPSHADVGSLDVKVTATDGSNASVSDELTLMVAADTIAPTATFNPVDGAAGVAVGRNIVVTFNETISLADSEGVVLHTGSATGTQVAASVAVSGSTLTIDPTASLASGTHYYVTFADGSVLDLAGNNYGEYAEYDFTTVAAADPYADHGGDGGSSAGAILAGVAAVGLLAWVIF